MKSSTRKPTHGGTRPGAGRPILDNVTKVKPVIVQLPPLLILAIDHEAEARGINRSELIRRAILAYLP